MGSSRCEVLARGGHCLDEDKDSIYILRCCQREGDLARARAASDKEPPARAHLNICGLERARWPQWEPSRYRPEQLELLDVWLILNETPVLPSRGVLHHRPLTISLTLRAVRVSEEGTGPTVSGLLYINLEVLLFLSSLSLHLWPHSYTCICSTLSYYGATWKFALCHSSSNHVRIHSALLDLIVVTIFVKNKS